MKAVVNIKTKDGFIALMEEFSAFCDVIELMSIKAFDAQGIA